MCCLTSVWHTIVKHCNDVIMIAMASQITSLTIVYSTVYSGVHQRKHQSSASLAFVRGIHRWPVNSPHKRPVTRKMFPFDDVIMLNLCLLVTRDMQHCLEKAQKWICVCYNSQHWDVENYFSVNTTSVDGQATQKAKPSAARVLIWISGNIASVPAGLHSWWWAQYVLLSYQKQARHRAILAHVRTSSHMMIVQATLINSLWPSDAIWRQRSGSTLAKAMACCLTAPSYYLNQSWLIISEVQTYSH